MYGKKIRELRIVKALSQSKLAEKAQIQINTLQDIEKGKRMPRPSTLGKIAKALAVTPEELLSDIPSITDGFQDKFHNKVKTIACGNDDIAGFLISKIIYRHLSKSKKPCMILPTGRTAALLFSSLLDCLGDEEIELLCKTTYFIDTETFGVENQMSSSRGLFVRNNFINELKTLGINIPECNIHFFDGVVRKEGQLAEYDFILKGYSEIIHVLAVSPTGEILGYESDTYNEKEEFIHDRCNVLHLSEIGKNYIDPTQPSRGIISLGFANMLDTNQLLLFLVHKNKSHLLEMILSDKRTVSVPSSLISLHENVTIVTTKSVLDKIDVKYGFDEICSREEALKHLNEL